MQIKNPNNVPCSIEGCTSIYIARARDWICGYHLQIEYNQKSIQGKQNWLRNRKPIPNKSAKRKLEESIYIRKKKAFLALPENKVCFIQGCQKRSTTIEHRAGRIGSNYLDESTWAGCCWSHNIQLENDPELSKKYQLSKIHGGKKI